MTDHLVFLTSALELRLIARNGGDPDGRLVAIAERLEKQAAPLAPRRAA